MRHSLLARVCDHHDLLTAFWYGIDIARLPGNVALDQNKDYGDLEFTNCDAQRNWTIRKID